MGTARYVQQRSITLARVSVLIALLVTCGCGVDWFPDSTGTFTNTSTAKANTSGGFTNNSTGFSNRSTASPQFSREPVSDSTGTLTVQSIGAEKKVITSSSVTYSMYCQILNSGSSGATAEVQYRGVDKDGTKVLGGTLSKLVNANSTAAVIYIVGTPLSITQWNKISRWETEKVTKK